MSNNLVFCDDCDNLVDTEIVDGNVQLSCGCDPDSYLREEDCQPLDFNAETTREYEEDLEHMIELDYIRGNPA